MERLTERNRDRCEMCTSYVDGFCLEQWYPCDMYETYERLQKIEDILGDDYDLSRLRDLVQADRDGRCVVLPVKTGDNIYFTFLGKIIKKQVFSVVTFCNSQRIYCDGTSEFFRPDDIGKTVFLTSEDAEGALKGEKHA